MTNYAKQKLQTVFFPLAKHNASMFSSLDRKYRSRLEILALILESVKDRDAAPSFVRQQAQINHKQLKNYLKCLRSIGFIEAEVKDDQILYRASHKGLAFLAQYYILWEMIFKADIENTRSTRWLEPATFRLSGKVYKHLTSLDARKEAE